MRYAHICNAVLNEPWMITPRGHAMIVALLQSKLTRAGVIDKKEKPDLVYDEQPQAAQRFGMDGEKLESMYVVGGRAVIPVRGVLANRISAIEKSCGATDYSDINRDINEANGRDDVRDIILDIASPGGAVAGLAGCAQRIVMSSKPTAAFIAGECASAALYLAVACNKVFAEPGSLVGSVGTIFPFIDQSEAFKSDGLRVDLITSTESPFKGAAFPGTSLSDEQRAYLQELVDKMDADFRGFVKERRPAVSPEALKGNVFTSADAVRYGVIDGIVNGVDSIPPR